MANTSGIQWGVGLRRAVVFPLNSDGTLKATSTTVYEGLEFSGPRAFDITYPDARLITNPGNDRVRDQMYLPPTDPVKCELRTGFDDQAINAALMGVSQFTVGESTLVPFGTDKQGSEADIALLLYQQAHDDSKLTRWRYVMIPRARAIPMPAGMNDNALETRYSVSISPSTKHIWNVALQAGTEGCTEMALADGMAEGKPAIVAWKADGTATVFSFPTDKQAISTAKINLFDASTGAEVTVGITKATSGITYGVAPAANKILVARIEY